MPGRNAAVERLFRWIGYLGTALVVVGILVFAVGALRAASEAGYSSLSIPIKTEEMRLLLFGGGGVFLLGVLVNVLGRTVAAFLRGRREGPAGDHSGADSTTSQLPQAERYRRTLARTYLYIAGMVFAVVLLASSGSAIPGEAGELVASIARVSIVVLFGSVDAAFLTALLLGGLWYGVDRRSAEALLVGACVAVLFVLSTLQYGAFGLTIAGLLIVYYSIKARTTVEFLLVEATSVPDPLRRFVE